jgi:hypothetical protein
MMTEINAFPDGMPEDGVGDDLDMAACEFSC